ncbi:MAG: 2Fe-2S iron-sulfur cluster-binding protein [Acidobacteria bacterium]|nr:2Fe-2S iron-sulfur cluster-binding protein [Acidobacteriota bacterium]
MPTLHWEGQSIAVAPGESALDALLGAGVSIPHSCRAGACQSCLLQATAGEIPPSSQQGLKPALIAQGYLLSCLCRPETDLHLAAPGPGARVPAVITKRNWLSESVLQVHLTATEPLDHRPGQYLTLLRADGLARSYSIAGQDLELHVRRIPGGAMSNWLADAAPGAQVTLQGPAGDCFYTPGDPHQPIPLAGAGTGLAPLYGILRDALRHGHQGPIWLYHGALNERGLYLTAELEALAAAHPNVHYQPTLFHRDGPLPEVLAAAHPRLSGWRGFVCGDPQIVNLLRKRLFLAGMASRAISADAFLPTTLK